MSPLSTASFARYWPRAGLALFSLLGAGACLAAETVTAVISLSVTVQEKPSCVINDNLPIEVDFGELMTNKIDGVLYRRAVTYSLKCKFSDGKSMRMNILGKLSSFDSKALITSVPGLGIRLYAADQVLTPGAAGYRFVYPSQPVLAAVPVKDPAVTMSGGGFSAVATLEVEYL